MGRDCISRSLVSKCLSNIPAAEQHLSVLLNGADAAKVGIFEDLQVIHLVVLSCLYLSGCATMSGKGGENFGFYLERC